MVFLTLVVASIVLFIIWNLWDRKRKLSWLQSIGIPCDPPSFLLGNMASFQEKGMHGQMAEWTQKYGKLFGYYEGPRSVLVVADVDMIKQIMVKDFSSFQARKTFPTMNPHEKFAHLFVTYGARWKRQRSLLSPTFSARRMKEMSPLINGTVDHLMQVLQANVTEGTPLDIHELFQKLTLDTIACCAFGIEVDCLHDGDSEFLRRCKQTFSLVESMSGWMKIVMGTGFLFPDFFRLVRPYVVKTLGSNRPWFFDLATKIIEGRKREKTSRVDFIQLMLNAEETDVSDVDLSMHLDDPEETGSQDSKNGTTGKVNDQSKPRTAKSWRAMTIDEMLGQCMLFLLAGYETTSTSLAFLAYELALNPDVQEKLRQEIDEYFPKPECRPDYMSVARMPYFDMVFNEVLRLHPIGPLATTRVCTQPCNVGGVPFRKGDQIQINMAAVHHDPALWGPEDTRKLVPERFLPERIQTRHPMAWLPFGGGPRNCVGMRFALLEVKVTLVRLLKAYVIRSCDQTEVPLSVCKNAVISPSKGVWITLEARS